MTPGIWGDRFKPRRHPENTSSSPGRRKPSVLPEAGLGFLGAAQRNDTCLEDTGPSGSGRTWTCHGTRGWSARVSLLTRRTASRFPWRSPTATSGLSPWCSLPPTALLPGWVGMGGSWLISKSHNPWPQGCRDTRPTCATVGGPRVVQIQWGETVHCPFSGILVPGPQTLSLLRAASSDLASPPPLWAPLLPRWDLFPSQQVLSC